MNLLRIAQSAWKNLTKATLVLAILSIAPGAIAQGIYRPGDDCPEVESIQRAVRVSVDGQYGSETEQAVRDFQLNHGLQVDGIAGPDTLRALDLQDLAERSSSCNTASSGSGSRSRPYVVVVPGSGTALLSRVTNVVPDAIQDRSRLGSFIRAGSFTKRSGAERVSRRLRNSGLDARVAYRP
jgi:peptidoglycan hydrolase-like protein with peptidoglycan-binding domain